MSLLFNMLSRLVITFLPRSKRLLISWVQSPSAMILEPLKIKSVTVSPSICHEVMGSYQQVPPSHPSNSTQMPHPLCSLFFLSSCESARVNTSLHMSQWIIIAEFFCNLTQLTLTFLGSFVSYFQHIAWYLAPRGLLVTF